MNYRDYEIYECQGIFNRLLVLLSIKIAKIWEVIIFRIKIFETTKIEEGYLNFMYIGLINVSQNSVAIKQANKRLLQ